MQLLSTVFCISNQTRTTQALEMQGWHLAFTANLLSSAHKFYSYLCTLGILLSSLFLSVWLSYFLCWWQSSEELNLWRILCPHNHLFLRILHMFFSLFHSKIYDQLQFDYHEICCYIHDPQRINLLIIYWPHVVHTSPKTKRSPVNTEMIMSLLCTIMVPRAQTHLNPHVLHSNNSKTFQHQTNVRLLSLTSSPTTYNITAESNDLERRSLCASGARLWTKIDACDLRFP